jgi:sulfide:quinone oxidoreductase
MYNSALGVIFAVKKYADELLKVVERKGIKLNFKRKLVEVNGDSKQAIFEVLEENRTESYPVS